MRRFDDENDYPLWCRIAGHRWWRPFYPADSITCWQRRRSCHRCEHILRGIAEVEARWRVVNEQTWTEQQGKCRCGAPATHVRNLPVMGAVPYKVFTCAEHVNVNAWSSRAGGTYAPSNPHLNFDQMESRWSGRVRPIGADHPDYREEWKP